MNARYLAAVDLGAGRGAKTGIFDLPAKEAPLGRPLVTGLLPIQEYGKTAEALAANLARILRADAGKAGGGEIAAAGIGFPSSSNAQSAALLLPRSSGRRSLSGRSAHSIATAASARLKK
jgi:hypothetical protein